MGSAVSAGSDNDELTDNLCHANYIRSPRVERLFRVVDRGEYIVPEHRMNAYKDQAWRCNHLHLSAPCIYSEVLEGLGLAPGMSFLNLGSGTGYLSTLVGLVLGSGGINHGVEYYEDVIQYANKKLEDFKRYSGAIDEFDFCEPKFMQGNCLCLTNDRPYDRVYVGAACPAPFDHYLKNFVKVGGILIVPFHDQLLQVRREAENVWDMCSLLPVSFATLILPKEDRKESFDLMDIQPDSLQCLCRNKIRNILRSNVEFENPDLCRPATRLRKSPRKARLCYRRTFRTNTLMLSAFENEVGPLHGIPDPTYLIREILHHTDTSSDEDDDHNEMNSEMNDEGAPDETMQQNDDDDIETTKEVKKQSSDNNCHQGTSSTSTMVMDVETESKDEAKTSTAIENQDAVEGTVAENVNGIGSGRSNQEQAPKTDHQRRKFDSGIGDEESTDDEPTPDRENQNKRSKLAWFNQFLKNDTSERALDSSSTSSCDTIEVDNRRWEDLIDDDDDDDEEDEDDSDDTASEREQMEYFHKRRTINSPFTELMRKKINELPLPPTLKSFLNFYRF